MDFAQNQIDKHRAKAIASLFNPLDKPIQRRIVLPLYYAGLSGKAEVTVGDDAPFKTFALDAACRTAVDVEIPANGNIRIYVRTASGHCMNAGFVTRQNVY